MKLLALMLNEVAGSKRTRVGVSVADESAVDEISRGIFDRGFADCTNIISATGFHQHSTSDYQFTCIIDEGRQITTITGTVERAFIDPSLQGKLPEDALFKTNNVNTVMKQSSAVDSKDVVSIIGEGTHAATSGGILAQAVTFGEYENDDVHMESIGNGLVTSCQSALSGFQQAVNGAGRQALTNKSSVDAIEAVMGSGAGDCINSSKFLEAVVTPRSIMESNIHASSQYFLYSELIKTCGFVPADVEMSSISTGVDAKFGAVASKLLSALRPIAMCTVAYSSVLKIASPVANVSYMVGINPTTHKAALLTAMTDIKEAFETLATSLYGIQGGLLTSFITKDVDKSIVTVNVTTDFGTETYELVNNSTMYTSLLVEAPTLASAGELVANTTANLETMRTQSTFVMN